MILPNLLAIISCALIATNLHLNFYAQNPTELFLPGVVSTEASEIRITFSPNGSRMLWGSTNRTGGVGGWDIWESVLNKGSWSAPRPATFNSPANDFDPSFSSDGTGVYFFSNRHGGLGGDDIWFVPFDPTTATYGSPRNLGGEVNSAGDEWAPVESPDGKRLVFASDGRGGKGLHDLFISTKVDGKWLGAIPLKGDVNSADEDFDATFLHDGVTLIFSRRTKDQDGADLFVSREENGQWTKPFKLGEAINVAGSWNLGPSINLAEPDRLYFTSNRPGNAVGRSDIYRVTYTLTK